MLIQRVEIKYFRSFNDVSFDRLNDTNVIFGENDSGKSNLARALNLFFNDRVSDNCGADFDIYFSRARRSVCNSSSDTRKYFYIKVHFRTPSNYKRSLGKEFYVKKQWNADDSTPNIRYSKHLINKTTYVKRFLNNIKFYYIPAVKGRDVFSNLLGSGLITSNR